MATGRPQTFTLCLALAWASGCAGPNPFTSRQTTMGSLKASVSQLEFENEKLRKDLGELKADNTRLDNQLAQESAANGELTARLDDAKDLIRSQGGDTKALAGPWKDAEDDVPPPASTPKARRTRGNRTSPAVSIPSPETPPLGDDVSLRIPRQSPRDLGDSDDSDDNQWLPVARGLPSAVTVRK